MVQAETDLGEIANSSLSLSGSDQTRSAIGPSCGISARSETALVVSILSEARFSKGWQKRTTKAVYDFDLVDSVDARTQAWKITTKGNRQPSTYFEKENLVGL